MVKFIFKCLVLLCLSSGVEGYTSLEKFLAQQKLHNRSPIDLSPDGEWLAVTVVGGHEEASEPDSWFTRYGVSSENVGTFVLLVNTETKKQLRPFPENSTSFTPQWSPDGQKLAVYLRENGRYLRLAIWFKETEEYVCYDEAWVRPATGWAVPQWTPDSQSIIFSRIDKDPLDPERKLEVGVLRHGIEEGERLGGNQSSKHKPNLVRLNLKTRQLVTVAEKVDPTQWKVSPQEQFVAYFERLDMVAGTQVITYHLALSDLKKSGEKYIVVSEIAVGSWSPAFDWSPDGRYIAYTYGGKVFVVDTSSKSKPVLPTEVKLPAKINFAKRGEVNFLWSAESDALYLLGGNGLGRYELESEESTAFDISLQKARWLRHGKYNTLPALLDNQSYVVSGGKVLSIDLERGTIARDLEVKVGGSIDTEVTSDESVAYLKRTYHVERLNTKTGKKDIVLRLTPPFPRNKLNIKKIDWTLPDGRKAKGELLLPPDYKKGTRLPTVLQIYAGGGGRIAMAVVEPTLLAAEGYAVFFPQLPLKGPDPMAQIPKLLDSATDALLAAGYSDGDKLAIMGHSYGGYSVLSTIVATDRYRTAIAANGAVDLFLAYHLGMIGWVESGQGATGGSVWEKRDAFIENSPYLYFDRVNTPVLFISGSADRAGAAAMYSGFLGLKRLDKPTEIRIYEGGQHGPVAWPMSQQRDLHAGVFQWLKRFLK